MGEGETERAAARCAKCGSDDRVHVEHELVILVVDDDEGVRVSTREVLEYAGYAVEVAANGAIALARLKSPPLPSLVLLDLYMPVMDGETLLSEIKGTPGVARIPVVVFSAARTFPIESRYPCLRKRFSLDDLLSIVDTTLRTSAT
jgi:CheY-like chemotaxis protein